MKRIISLLFLIVLVLQNVSDLYVLTRFYINRQYIAQNLCENRFDAVQLCMGKCYLAKELKKKAQQKQKFPDLKQKQINLFCQKSSLDNIYSGSQPTTLVFFAEENNYSNSFLISIFHPPKA